jgi:hypothetical protein
MYANKANLRRRRDSSNGLEDAIILLTLFLILFIAVRF